MSEVMTVEAIVEAEWILDGYWSKPRFSFPVYKSWSDVDVLSYKPSTKHLVISESKVDGKRNDLFAYTSASREKHGSILEFDKSRNQGEIDHFSFTRHLHILCQDGTIFPDFSRVVDSLTIQLVNNYVITDDVRNDVDQELANMIPRDLPLKSSSIHFQLDTTMDVFARIIEKERNSAQNKRHGNPVIDIAREINRYFYPKVRYPGLLKAGREDAQVREAAISQFLKAVGVNPCER